MHGQQNIQFNTHTSFISWSIVWNTVQKISAECFCLILRFEETGTVNAVRYLVVWMNFHPYVTLIVGVGCNSIWEMFPQCGWEFVNFVKICSVESIIFVLVKLHLHVRCGTSCHFESKKAFVVSLLRHRLHYLSC